MKNKLASRRRVLCQLAAGAAGGLSGLIQQALAADASVQQGMRRVSGSVLVNGVEARVGTRVPAGATIVTGPGAEAAYVVGRDAYLQRAGSQVELPEIVKTGLRITTGALLAVFARGAPKTVHTAVLTAGIRGTGCYVHIEARRTYFCLCYGSVELTPQGGAMRAYSTKHHDSPYWVENGAITPAQVSNHADAELVLLESLVGRKVPFGASYTR